MASRCLQAWCSAPTPLRRTIKGVSAAYNRYSYAIRPFCGTDQADPVTRTFKFRVSVNDPPPAMRLGVTVTGRLDTSTRTGIALAYATASPS